MSEINNRIQLDEEIVGTIAGGRLCYRGTPDNRFLYSNENPSVKYSFLDSKMPDIGQAVYECYGQSDEYTINYLLSKNLIKPM